MIVAVASEKGGTGKTTLSTNLAVMRAQQGNDVLLIDADPQGSALDFSQVREEEAHQPEITCAAIQGKGTHSEVRKMAPRFDDIVIDVGGRDSATLRGALLVADMLIVPCLPSQLDAWSVEHMDELVGEALGLNGSLKPYVVFNKVDTNPKIALFDEALAFSNELKNLKILDIRIGYRVSYRRAVAEGQAVNELTRKDARANEEMKSLYKMVFNHA